MIRLAFWLLVTLCIVGLIGSVVILVPFLF